MGVDLSLKKELKAYQVKDTIRSILNHKQEIEEKVQMLISDSLSAYYFDRLGDRLLELKNLLSGDAEAEAVEPLIREIGVLLEGYNQYSGRQISIESILPGEIISRYSHFIQSAE